MEEYVNEIREWLINKKRDFASIVYLSRQVCDITN